MRSEQLEQHGAGDLQEKDNKQWLLPIEKKDEGLTIDFHKGMVNKKGRKREAKVWTRIDRV